LISKLAKFKQMHYLKKALLSLENIKDSINFWPETQLVMLQSGVFENLLRNIIINASLPQWSMEEECHWVRSLFSFTVKSHLMLWSRGEYCMNGLLPTNEKLLSEEW